MDNQVSIYTFRAQNHSHVCPAGKSSLVEAVSKVSLLLIVKALEAHPNSL